MKVLKCYEGDAILIAAHLIKRMPTKVLENQPLANKLMTLFPNFEGVGALPPKAFKCVSYVHILKHLYGKLDPRVVKCVFLGYFFSKKGYK